MSGVYPTRQYTVTTIPGKGQLIKGEVSLGDASHFMSAFAKDHPKAFVHPGIANAMLALIALVEDDHAAKKWEQEIADDLMRRYYDCPEYRWFYGTDIGLSSKALYYAATFGKFWPSQVAMPSGEVPADADDLGRCTRMIQAIPSVRENLPAVLARAVELWPWWEPYVDAWDHITGLVEYSGGESRIRLLYGQANAIRSKVKARERRT